MTVNSTVKKSRQLGNGTTTAFSANIKIFAETDIVVQILTRSTSAVEKTLTLNDAGADGYTVSFDTDDETLTVTCMTAPTSTQDVFINRSIPITQDQDYPQANKLPSQAMENGLDKLTTIVQDNQDDLDRSIKVAAADTSVDGTLASINGNAGAAIVVNSGEDGFGYRQLAETETIVNFNKYTFDGDGSTTVFTLPQSITVQNALEVYIVDSGDNLRQEPVIDFTASGTTLTFTTAPASGTNNIWVVDTATSASASVPADASVTTDKIVDGAVTKSKIEDLSNYTVLGNVSGGSTAPAEVTIYDEDDMSSNSATGLVTQQSLVSFVSWTHVPAVDLTASSGSSPKTLLSGLPSNVSEIQLFFNDVSPSGTDSFLIQLSDGTFVTSGYLGTSGFIVNGGDPTISLSTSGFGIVASLAATTLNGVVNLEKGDGNNWYFSHTLGRSDAQLIHLGGGSVALSSALQGIRIATSGSDTFDDGTISAKYK